MVDEFYVFEWIGFFKDLYLVGNGFVVFFFDGWKVGSWIFDGFLSRYLNFF